MRHLRKAFTAFVAIMLGWSSIVVSTITPSYAAALTASFLSSNFNRGQNYTNAPFVGASGGTAPYTYSVVGTLPTGFRVNADGTLSGYTCDPNGSYGTFTVTVTDATSATASKSATFNVNRAPPGGCSITLSSSFSPSTGTTGTPYSGSITTTGATGSVTYSVTNGTLPAGLTLDPSTGQITGTPTAAGTSTFTILATDSSGNTGSQTYSITITAPGGLAITTPSLPTPTLTQPYAQTVNTTGGTAPITFAVTGGGVARRPFS